MKKIKKYVDKSRAEDSEVELDRGSRGSEDNGGDSDTGSERGIVYPTIVCMEVRMMILCVFRVFTDS